MRAFAAILAALLLSADAAHAEDVTEPRSGVKLPARVEDMSLLGIGLRTRYMVKAKVYAIGLYVADTALAGPLAVHKGKPLGPAFYKDLVSGDFDKQLTLHFVRDVGTDRIRNAFRESLVGADKARVDAFVAYFTETKEGQEYVLRVRPGGVLETTVKGEAKPPIADKNFSAAVFSIWLGEKPIQEDIKKDIVARAPSLLK